MTIMSNSLTRLLRQIIVIFCLSLYLSACGGGSSSSEPQPVVNKVSIEQATADAVQAGLDGVFLYVEQSGSVEYHTAGFQDIRNQVPATENALFKIASISKLFIAVASAKMVDQGTISIKTALSIPLKLPSKC